MRKRFFQGTGAMCLALLLAAGITLSGCGSNGDSAKADEKRAANAETLIKEDFGGLKHTATEYSLEMVCTKADKKKLTTGSLTDLFTDNEDAYLSDSISYQTVYEVEGYDDVYIALTNTEDAAAGTVSDWALYPDGKTDGVEFDAEYGIVYIPKALCGEEGLNLGIHILVAADVAEVVPKE